MTRMERIGDATLYLGDCREILPGIERAVDEPRLFAEPVAKAEQLSMLDGAA